MENNWYNEVVMAAAQRGGVLLTRDLAGKDLCSDDIEVAVKGLHRLRRGAYLIEAPDAPRERHRQLARSAAMQHPGDPVISHVSAAVLHDFAVEERHLGWVHLTLAEARGGRRNGIHTHLADLHSSEVSTIDGVAVTSPRRTVIDCARMLPLVEAVVIADQALSKKFVELADLIADAKSLGRRPGGRAARHAMSLADPGGESPGETRTRLILVRGGFELDTQVEICDADDVFIGRVDMKLRNSPVVIEFDGRVKYGLNGDVEAAYWSEKLRDDELHEAGHPTVRVVWKHLVRPGGVLRRVEAAVDRAEGGDSSG
jgi:hypothetical protein